MRIDRAHARMAARSDESTDAQKPDDPVARLRQRADNMAASAAALKKIADAADPLYKTLDDGHCRFGLRVACRLSRSPRTGPAPHVLARCLGLRMPFRLD